MNYIFEPVNKTQLNKFLKRKDIHHLLVGIKGLTHGNKLKLTIEEVNELLLKTNKISLDVTRIFHEDELALLKENIEKINMSNVKYVFYSDFAVLETLKQLSLSDKAVYDSHTYLTNEEDVKLYSDFNKYVVVSNQISIDEIKNLLNKIEKKVMIHGFGRSIIFYSKRELLTNYFLYRNFKNKAKNSNYYLKEEFREELYPIYEDEHGTYIYEKGYYYLFEELTNLNNVDFVIIHSTLLNSKIYEEVVNSYLGKKLDKLENLKLELSKGIMENKSVLLKSEVTKNE